MANPNKQPLALERCRLRTPHPRLRVACFLPSCRKQPQHLLHPRPKRLVCFAGPFLSIFFKLFSFFFFSRAISLEQGPTLSRRRFLVDSCIFSFQRFAQK